MQKLLLLLVFFLSAVLCCFAQNYPNKYEGSQYQDEINAREAEEDAAANDPVTIHLSNAMDAANSSFDFAKQTAQGAQDALDELTNLKEDDKKDVVQYYADKAKGKMKDADSNAKQASDAAETAQYEADQASCSSASGNAQSAAAHIKTGKETLHTAYLKLIDATGNEDADVLIGYLTAAYNSLIDGAKDLNKAAVELNTVFDALNDCN